MIRNVYQIIILVLSWQGTIYSKYSNYIWAILIFTWLYVNNIILAEYNYFKILYKVPHKLYLIGKIKIKFYFF